MSSRCCRCCWNGEPSSNGDEDGRAFDRLRGRGQGVQQSHGATVPQGAQDRSGDPDQSRQSVRPRLRPGGVARAQRRGAAHQPPQAVAAHRHPLRKASGQLSGHAEHRRHRALVVGLRAGHYGAGVPTVGVAAAACIAAKNCVITGSSGSGAAISATICPLATSVCTMAMRSVPAARMGSEANRSPLTRGRERRDSATGAF